MVIGARLCGELEQHSLIVAQYVRLDTALFPFSLKMMTSKKHILILYKLAANPEFKVTMLFNVK